MDSKWNALLIYPFRIVLSILQRAIDLSLAAKEIQQAVISVHHRRMLTCLSGVLTLYTVDRAGNVTDLSEIRGEIASRKYSQTPRNHMMKFWLAASQIDPKLTSLITIILI